MKELSFKQIKLRIIISVILIIVIFASLFAWRVASERKELIKLAENQTSGYAKALSEHAERTFAETDRVLRDILHDTRVTDKKPQDISEKELYNLMKRQTDGAPQIGDIFIVNSKGLMFNNTNSYPPKKIDVSDREYFKYYASNPHAGLTIGRPVKSRLVGRWRFNLMRPLAAAGKSFDGLIAVAFEVEYFKKFFDSAALGNGVSIILLDMNGNPLVFEPYFDGSFKQNFVDYSFFSKNMLSSDSGTLHDKFSVIDNASRIISFKKINNYPIISVVSVSEDEILQPWKKKFAIESTVGSSLCGFIVFLAYILFNHINRLHLAQQALYEQHKQLEIKAIQVDTARDAIMILDETGKIIQSNPAFSTITGYSHEELEKMGINEIKPPEFAGRVNSDINNLLINNSASFESAYISKSGEIIPVEIHAQLINIDNRKQIVSIARDIRERKSIENREATRLQILERMASGDSLENVLSIIVRFVEQQSPGALCSVLLADLNKMVLRHGAAPSLPEDYNKAVNGLRIANKMGSCGTAAFLKSRVIVENISTHPYWKGFKPAEDAGLFSCWSEPVISSDGNLLGTFAIYHKEPRLPSDEEIRLIVSAANLASLAISKHNSEKLQKELQQQLLHIQKIESIGQLAGGIAHDFNNLLTPILAYSDMLKISFNNESEQTRKLNGIIAAADKAKTLTQKLLSFSRKHIVCMDALNLNSMIFDMQDMMQRTLASGIELQINVDHKQQSHILGDKGQLEQFLLNLVINARDAMHGAGRIEITLSSVEVSASQASKNPGMFIGKAALLCVKDNGCGMSRDVLEHIFEPFFTTKNEGEGTGLGLAMGYAIVKQHGGHIAVESKLNNGTTFNIYLPEIEANGEKIDSYHSGIHGEAELLSGTILIVEDNDTVRTVASELLEAKGFKVLASGHPVDAVSIFKNHSFEIDLLLTDIVMPTMNGRELYEQLIKVKEDIPVVFISGYTNDIIKENQMDSKMVFLQKPFTPEQLYAAISKGLKRV